MNLWDAHVAVITNIALDHVDVLRDDIESGTKQKVGILKDNKRSFSVETHVLVPCHQSSLNPKHSTL